MAFEKRSVAQLSEHAMYRPEADAAFGMVEQLEYLAWREPIMNPEEFEHGEPRHRDAKPAEAKQFG